MVVRNIDDNSSQYLGKIENASKGLTLDDIVKYKSQTSWLGSTWSKMVLSAQGKGWVTTASIQRIIDNLGKDKLETLKSQLATIDNRGLEKVKSIVDRRLQQLKEVEDHPVTTVFNKLIGNEELTDDDANIFNQATTVEKEKIVSKEEKSPEVKPKEIKADSPVVQNKPPRQEAMNLLLRSMTIASKVDWEKKSWDIKDDLDENLSKLSDLDEFAEMTEYGTVAIDTYKLQEELGTDNHNIETRKEFLGTFIKGLEAALISNNPEVKKAAENVLNTMFPGMNFADKIVDLRREAVVESPFKFSNTSVQQKRETLQAEIAAVTPTYSQGLTKLADQMRSNVAGIVNTGKDYILEDLDYEFNLIAFHPRDPDVNYTTNDLIDLRDDNSDAFEDFTAFLNHLSILVKLSPDNSQRLAAETIIEALGGNIDDFRNL